MSQEHTLSKERERLSNMLQNIPDAKTGENEKANAIIDKITSLNIALGKHTLSKRSKLSPTFTKTYK